MPFQNIGFLISCGSINISLEPRFSIPDFVQAFYSGVCLAA